MVSSTFLHVFLNKVLQLYAFWNLKIFNNDPTPYHVFPQAQLHFITINLVHGRTLNEIARF